jgi:NTP pyrophosphatase (non-canonical NTP hydrolase)
LNIDEYQIKSAETINNNEVSFFLWKLKSEVLEVEFEIFRILYDKKDNKKDLELELGDCLRNVAQLATICDIKMSDILESNISKMDRRVKDKII